MKKVPITWAEKIADRVGAQGVVILTFDGEHVGGTSYGATKVKCGALGRWMDGVIDRMETEALPAPEL